MSRIVRTGRPPPVQKRRKPKIKPLEDLASKHKYVPGDYIIQSMMQNRKQIEEWDEYLRIGEIPPELSMSYKEAKRLYRACMLELKRDERAMLEYFHPKKRSVDADVDVQQPVNLIIEGLED